MSGNAGSLIEVLLPVRDGARYVAESIRSVQAQTHTNWRLLVLDDGSVDETRAIVKALAGDDRRIELHPLPRRGLIATLNEGLSRCTGEFVARQDADDISFPHRFAFEVEYLQSHPDCVAVSGGRTMIDADGRQVDGGWSPPGAVGQDPYRIPAREPYLMHPFLLVRREVWMRLGGYRHFLHTEDSDLCWRLSEAGPTFSAPEVLGKYRRHKDSVSTASLVNTRTQALLSQVAAIAARRRREGRGDFVPQPELSAQLQPAETLEEILDVVREQLHQDEIRFVDCAGVMKLFEISLYRPITLQLPDLRHARRVLRALPPCSPENKRQLAKLCRKVWAAMRAQGQRGLAAEIGPSVWGRLLVGSRLPRFGRFRALAGGLREPLPRNPD